MPINRLSAVDVLAAGDQLALYSAAQGDDRRASLTALMTYIEANLTVIGNAFVDFTTQYSAPAASGFNVQITDDDTNTHLILTPVAGYAAGTITLPQMANAADKQQILINCTQAVTTLTVAGNGATVAGAPTTLAANAYFRLKYDLAGTTWYRVG